MGKKFTPTKITICLLLFVCVIGISVLITLAMGRFF